VIKAHPEKVSLCKNELRRIELAFVVVLFKIMNFNSGSGNMLE